MTSSIGGIIRDEPLPVGPDGGATAHAEHALTFVFTDVEGSTRLWERSPEAMRRALERHDDILGKAIEAAGGTVVKATGDGVMAVFGSAPGALAATLDSQRRLLAETWPDSCRISVRMGVHSGEVQTRAGDYFGPTVNRAARIMAAAHGGQVIVSSSTAGLVGESLPAGMTLRDLGEHRLKDLERSERLFQVVHPDMPAEFAPLATLDRRPNNLPTQMSAFVGRDAELQEIRARLEDGSVRLIVLTGPGGTGKTRLALRAAADEVDRFANGVFFVDLSSATDADSVFGLVAAALGLGQDTDQAPLAEVKRLLKEQQVLLVLDNFEQTISAAPALVELLQDCPQLKLLVTSREALRLRGESVFSVPPLSLPATEGVDSAAEVSRFEAIQLFVERARAARGDFHLTDDNAAAVVEICRRLDGLPLAIELATARLNLFSPDALRDRLGQRMKLLASGPRDLPARQQTLRATIEWSYHLLDAQEQRLFELLSVFSGATFEAVEAVESQLGPGVEDVVDAIEGLASLLDKSLIRQPASGGTGPAPRVLMLETIREYASERLDARPDFAAAAREGHATYYADLGAHLLAGLDASSGAARNPELVAELENLRAAWRFWYARRDLDRLNQLLDPMWQIYELRGWYHATIGLINELLDVLSDAPPTQQRWEQEVTLRTSLARALTLLRGYTGEVEDAYERALGMFDRDQQPPQLYPVLKGLLSFHGFRADLEKSLEIANAMLRLADAQNDPSMRVDAYLGMGSNVAFAGELERGLGYIERGIETFETHRYQPRRLQLGIDPRISSLTTSGFVLALLGRPDTALARANRAIALAEEVEHPYSMGYALYHAGYLHSWRREPEFVRDRARSILQLVAVHDLPLWRALGTCLLGAATSELGDPVEGLRLVDEGLGWYQDLRTPPVFWPMIRFLQAGVYGRAGKAVEAMDAVDEAIGLSGEDSILTPAFVIGRGDLLLLIDSGNLGEATLAYEWAAERAAGFKARLPQLQATTRLVRVARSDAERSQRMASLGTIYETFTEGFSIPDLVEAGELLEQPA